MRKLVLTEATDIQSLGKRLGATAGGGATDATTVSMARLQQLNPHLVGVERLPPGTVVLVPGTPSRAGEATDSIGGQGFDELAAMMKALASSSAGRALAGHASRAAQQKEVATALKSRLVKKAIDADPELARQVQEAEAIFKADPQDAKASQQAFEVLEKEMAEELAALAKMLG